MWAAVQESCEATFNSAADWQRLRLEMWYADRVMASDQPSASAGATIQAGLTEMLLSPAVKRRAGIELRRAVDTDSDAAVSMVGKYRQMLKSV
jgi:hypothetical protein